MCAVAPAGASNGPTDPRRRAARPSPREAIITSSIHQPPAFPMTFELALKRTWSVIGPVMFAVRFSDAPCQLKSRPV